MHTRMKRGFTLIELLVVIAIIAILAAILFPVFAQAREKARQSACISNNKQLAGAIIMYTQDYDQTYPLSRALTNVPGVGLTWQYQIDVPANARTNNPTYVEQISSGWANSIQPYAKNYNILICPSATKEVPFANTAPGGGLSIHPFINVSYTYNGELQQVIQSSIVSVATVPLFHEGRGRSYVRGYAASNPILDCADPTLTCKYVPKPDPNSSACAGSAGDGSTGGGGDDGGGGTGSSNPVNGSKSHGYKYGATAEVHAQGVTMAFADGHAKYKHFSTHDTNLNQPTDANIEPWAIYDANQMPTYYWGDGCHTWFFKPEQDQLK